MMKRLIALMMCAVSLYATAQIFDESDIFYQSDFSQCDFEGWSKSQTIQYDNRTLLGNFGNETCSLTLVCMPPHTGLQLSFDLYALDTWDGNGTSSGGNDPDLWFCSIDGGTLIETTFGHASNNPQSYPDNYPSNNPPFAGAVQQSLGYFCYGQNGATAQYSLSFTIEHSVAGAEIIFGADLLQDLCDESWALGNVVVSLNGSSAAMGCTDLLACNYCFEAASDDGSCDYSCCPGPGCCTEGMYWDWELSGCYNINPADINLDGCVQLNDLLDLLSAYGGCGAEESAWQCGDPLEYQGYDYETVQIGEQCWFAENLRSESYENGDAIPAGLNSSEWTSTTSGATVIYDGNASNLEAYGRLYNWHAVDDARSLCPSTWRIPSDGDWTVLTDFLGGAAVAGGQMKTTYGWNGDGNGTNSSGFSGLPGGSFASNGNFNLVGSSGYWWSASPYGSSAWYRIVSYNDEAVTRNFAYQRNGYSVRCVRDAE